MRPTPPKREFVLDIDSLSNSGDGVARQDDRVVFVPGTAPGDRVRVRIVESRKRFARAEVLERLADGPDRVAPRCPVYERCGGCDWQHLSDEVQLAAHVDQLRETLRRVGRVDAEINPIAVGDRRWHYRNRIQGEFIDGRFHFRERQTGAPVAIADCAIADERINAWLAAPDRDSLATIAPGERVELAIVDDAVVVLPIDRHRHTRLGFRQVNDAVNARLVESILSVVGEDPAGEVLDLYCGRGLWTCAIADRYPDKHVLGIDVLGENIQAALQRKKAMQLANVTFRQSAVEKQLKALPLETSLCIVDPPRAGLDASVIRALVQALPRSLVYVSCHPATLARDIARLGDHFRVRDVQPFDMFPQTAQLEVRVWLEAVYG